MPLQLLRVASASQSLEEGSTPGRHCVAEDGHVEASTTSESQCSHLHTERCTVTCTNVQINDKQISYDEKKHISFIRFPNSELIQNLCLYLCK